jgi:hypothetical protein
MYCFSLARRRVDSFFESRLLKDFLPPIYSVEAFGPFNWNVGRSEWPDSSVPFYTPRAIADVRESFESMMGSPPGGFHGAEV